MQAMESYGYLRVAAGTPRVKVADVRHNVAEIRRLIDEAEETGVSLIVLPELAVTGYTCGDLFGSARLIDEAEAGVRTLIEHTEGLSVTVVVGTPVRHGHRLYNCAAVLRDGDLHGIVPKTWLPSYNEFYESRWFASGSDFLAAGAPAETTYADRQAPVSPNLLFEVGEATFAAELCEDLWTPVPPSSFHAVAGAQVIVNLSASNEVLLKHSYRHKLVSEQSAHALAAYVYCSAGYGESTQDLVFAGSSMIYENGTLLAEAERFGLQRRMIVADVDVEKLTVLRQKQGTFGYVTPDGAPDAAYAPRYARIPVGPAARTAFSEVFFRDVDPHPFVPAGPELGARCEEILSIQVLGLATRLSHVGAKTAVIGISGGLDSTLALVVAVLACDKLGWERERIVGVTMPGPGTTARTRTNAGDLMRAFGVTVRYVPIGAAVRRHFADIGHDPGVVDATYENAQARERTQVLMDIAGETGGLVVGTGDLSELALGWCTYNGDHMSMYGVNASVPKTLVRSLCGWVGETRFEGESSGGRTVREILADIVATPISPELVPAAADGGMAQRTEDLVGPYELHDFFLYHTFRFGASPSKVLFLARWAFGEAYDEATLWKWLQVFVRRFFSQQFKRSCLPDGPKVGSVSLSPRGDWRMPSDASPATFLMET